ncbi:MAG: hypothetical protein HUK12_00955 [Muribaculaceae bacterium]|nr:hypothetical protein [Muribaculaceae bacterium]
MKPDKKVVAALGEASKYLRKCADIIDKVAEGDTNEGEKETKAGRRRICD